MDESENEDHESTFFDSNYKETPKDDNPNLQVSYNLRSRRPDNQMSTVKDGAERTSNNNNIQHPVTRTVIDLNKILSIKFIILKN